jgi:excisionase family DNA binding protein
MNERLLGAEEAASILGITPRHLKSLVDRRELAHVKVGRLLRFRPVDLDAYIQAHVREVS